MAKDLTVGRPSKQMTLFALPMIVSVIFQQFYSMADNIIAGQCISDGALAAVGNAYPITMIYMAVALGINIGCSVVISQLFGAKDYGKTRSAVSTALFTTTALGLVMTLLGLLLAQPLLHLLQTPADIFEDTTAYLDIYTLGLCFIFLYNICTGTFNALGDSVTPLVFLIASSLANVFVNLLFVLVFQMGVAGLAWATFLCQGAAAALAFLVLMRKLRLLYRGPYRRFSGELLKKEAILSIPGILQQSFISVGNLLIQGVINSQGTAVIGAFSAVAKLNTFAVQLFTTVSNAVSAFTAQNIGAGKLDRIKQGLRYGITINLFISAAFALIYTLGSSLVLQIFVSRESTEILRIGQTFLHLVPCFYPLVCIKLSLDGVLHGAGDAKAFMVSTLADLVLRTALSFLLSPALGYYGVWIAWPIGWTVGTILSAWYYFRGGWKQIFRI